VRYFDAARSYGLAERFLGRWLRARSLDPPTITIGSKWGYTYTAGWRADATVHEVKDLSAAALRRQIAETRQCLGARLGLYQIHSATLESGVLEDGDVLAGLAQLKEEGLLVGLTASGPRQAETIRRAFDVRVDGVNPFQCVQATWNLLEPSAAPALADAHALGWGVIVKESLANGRLTSRGDAGQSAALRDVAQAAGVTADALAIGAVLSQPWADVVLSGAATEAHLASNLTAVDIRLDETHLAALRPLAESPEAYWTRRSQLPWL
jgi:aryl-alcohol dehydrogenase-like predicted oxidoreductase